MKIATVVLVVAFLLGAGSYFGIDRTMAAREPRSWPMDAIEKSGFKGVQSDYRALAEAIAPVVTGVKPGEILQFLVPRVLEVAATESAIFAAAERRCGCAVVASGATWVERR